MHVRLVVMVAAVVLASGLRMERWGAPPSWVVGHKVGFPGSTCCGWRVSSVGYVSDPAGGGYSIAVLSDRWGSLAEGVPLVEAGARVVATALTAPVAG